MPGVSGHFVLPASDYRHWFANTVGLRWKEYFCIFYQILCKSEPKLVPNDTKYIIFTKKFNGRVSEVIENQNK